MNALASAPTGELIAVDGYGNVIVAFTPDGHATLVQKTSTFEIYGLAIDPTGALSVANTSTHPVYLVRR